MLPKWRTSRAATHAHTHKNPHRYLRPGAPCILLRAGWLSDIPPSLHQQCPQRRIKPRGLFLAALCCATPHSGKRWSCSCSLGITNERGTVAFSFCFNLFFFFTVSFSPQVFLKTRLFCVEQWSVFVLQLLICCFLSFFLFSYIWIWRYMERSGFATTWDSVVGWPIWAPVLYFLARFKSKGLLSRDYYYHLCENLRWGGGAWTP